MLNIKISNGVRQEIVDKLENYLNLFPEEKNNLTRLINQIKNNNNIFDRSNMMGHITASGLVLSKDKKILLIFHNSLNKYLAPGGHIENQDKDIIAAAQREVWEESGLKHAQPHPWTIKNKCPLVIDSHPIPQNDQKAEGNHFHHDFMFLLTASDTKVSLDKNEVSNFKWLNIQDPIQDTPNLALALKKLQKLNIL